MNDYLTHELRRQQGVADAAADLLDLVEHEPVAGGDTVPVDQRLRQAGVGAAHADPIVLVETTFVRTGGADGHTRNTSQ